MRTEENAITTDLETTNAYLAAIVESSDDAIISKDLNGRITSWNHGAERIFGYHAGEAIGRSISILIPESRAEEETQLLARLRRGERIQYFETVRMAKDGRELTVSLTISPIRTKNGTIIGASKIARDITRQKQMERELKNNQGELQAYARDLEKRINERTARLQEAVSELEAFSYSVSHDLRAPLRAMRQYSETLLEDYARNMDETGRGYLTRISRSGAKLDAMIRDVLTYSRIIRAKGQLAPLDVDQLVRDIIQQYPNFQEHENRIHIEGELLPMMGHEAFLTQCVSNLLVNAIKFVSPDKVPDIRVRTDRRDQKVRLWIEDNGLGIAPEHHSRIFNLFERIHGDLQFEGTGIGLSIVKKAAERMGGTVGLESRPDKGSKFWVELPATDNNV
jgi:PAS domain S-box-containing protein